MQSDSITADKHEVNTLVKKAFDHVSIIWI